MLEARALGGGLNRAFEALRPRRRLEAGQPVLVRRARVRAVDPRVIRGVVPLLLYSKFIPRKYRYTCISNTRIPVRNFPVPVFSTYIFFTYNLQ